MKITDVQVRTIETEKVRSFGNALGTRLDTTEKGWTINIVEVFTDEGITGMVANDDTDLLTRQIICEQLRDVVIGEDPMAYGRLWRKMFGERRGWRHAQAKGEAIRAMSAIDAAVWDIIGKALNTPVYRLLGGYRNRVPCYASGGQYQSYSSHTEELRLLEAEVRQYMDMGFKAVKVRAGRDAVKDAERLKLVRDVIGQETSLMVDLNTCFSYLGGPPAAIKFIRALEAYNVYWFEDPLLMDDVSGMKQISDAVDTAIATGEAEQTIWGFRDLIATRAVDILLPDALMCGGVTEWVRIATMADAFRIPVAAHCVERVHVHCLAAVANALPVEIFCPREKGRIRYEQNPLLPGKDGLIEVPEAPGLGAEFDEDYIQAHLVA